MPKINLVRFINLGVQDSLLNIPDISFPFNAKSSYVIAGNGVGKSAIIGLLLNTLHPYKYSFIHGDSPIDRYFEEYILPDRPGLILIEWVLDTTDKELQYLLTGRLSWKTPSEGLQDLYFSKAYDNTEPRFIQNFSPVLNKMYKSRRQIRKEIVIEKFTTFTARKAWVENLNDYHIQEDIVKQLIAINKKEGAAKEGITFKTREGFISYLIDYIVPVPRNAFEFVETLQKGFSEFTEIPKFASIIAYFQEIQNLMKNSTQLQELHKTLLMEIKDFLIQEIAAIANYEGIKTKSEELLEKLKQEIEILIDKISNTDKNIGVAEREEKLRSIQFYKQSITEFQSAKETLALELAAKEKDLLYCTLFPQLNECKTISSQIDAKQQVLDTEQKPLLDLLVCRKRRFKDALSQHFQYTAYQTHQIENKISGIQAILETLTDEIASLGAKIEFTFQDQDKLITESNFIKAEEKKLLEPYPEFSFFDDARDSIECLKETKNLESKEIADKIMKLEKDKSALQSESVSLEKDKTQLTSDMRQLKSKKLMIHSSWKNLTSHIGFKLNIAVITSELPLFHFLVSSRIDSLNEILLTARSDLSTKQHEESILCTLLTYYDKYDTFPPNEDVTFLREHLLENGISAINGWDYYNENRNIIDKAWVNLCPYLFEGVIIQGTPLEDIHALISNLSYTSETPLFLTEATIFENTPGLLPRDKTISLNTISWKFTSNALHEYMIDKKEIHGNLKVTIQKKAENINHLQEVLAKISAFSQQTTEESYKTLNREIESTDSKYKTVCEELKRNFARTEKNGESLEILKNEKDKLLREISQLEKDLKPFYRLENQIKSLPEITKKIEKNESKIRQLRTDKDKAGQNRDEHKKEQDELDADKKLQTSVYQDINTYAENLNFTLHGSSSKKPIFSLSETRTDYLSLKNQLNQNENFQQIQLEIDKLDKMRFVIEKEVKAQLDAHNATFADAHKFLQEYENDHPRLFQMKRNLGAVIAEKNVEIAELENRISEFKNNEQDLLNDFPERVATTSLSSTELQASLKAISENLSKKNASLKRLIESKQKNNEAKTSLKELRAECISQMNLLSTVTQYIEISYNENFPKFNRKDVRIPESSPSVLNELQLESKKLKKSWDEEGKVKRNEIDPQIETYKGTKAQFTNDCGQLFEKGKNSNVLKDLEILNYLYNIRIDDIDKVIQETDLEIEQRELQLASQKDKRDIQMNLIVDELERSFDMINDFARKKINPKMSPAYKDKQPIRISYSFQTSELRETLAPFVKNIFANLNTSSSFPKEWESYLSFIKAMLESFFRGRIKSIKFLIPRKDGSAHYRNLKNTLKASGGQVNTIALVLFCLMAHFKVKNQKSMHYSDYEKLQKTPVSFPLISDNPIGSTSSPELVRLQLDVAKSLDIQLIYFSGHNIPELIEEMDVKMELQLTERNVLSINHTLNHTPIREENYEKGKN